MLYTFNCTFSTNFLYGKICFIENMHEYAFTCVKFAHPQRKTEAMCHESIKIKEMAPYMEMIKYCSQKYIYS